MALLCEGYATGASLHEHTGLPVAVGIDAGNLEPVALAIRGTYPRLRLLICGDHDAFKAGGNTGQEKAKAAAYALTGGAGWCVPDFLTPCDAEVLEAAGIDPSKSQRKRHWNRYDNGIASGTRSRSRPTLTTWPTG